MGYFSLDIKKAKGTSDTTQSDHIERKIIPKNADPTRTHLNRVLVEYPDGVHGRDEAIAGWRNDIHPNGIFSFGRADRRWPCCSDRQGTFPF